MYAVYARQSVYKEDSISIESQIEFCRYEVRNNKYKVYEDRGFSGKNTDRPQFQQMMQDIENGLISHVVVYKLDRISRSLLDFISMMDVFQKLKVEFISCSEKFDTTTPMGRAMLNICIIFAQLERETIQIRVTDAYHSRSKKGFYMGGRVPYGFSLQDTVIDGIKTSMYVENPEESEHIKLIYELYSDPSNSLGDIIKYFNAHNIKHLRDGSWSTPRLSEMLRSPVYVNADADIYNFFAGQGTEIVNPVSDFKGENACYLYKNAENKDTHKKKSTFDDKVLVIAPHKGFISSELWLKCRVRCMNNKQSTKTNKARNSWLLGKVKCGNCGSRLSISKSKTKMGRYFNCGKMLETKKADCQGTGGTVYADVLEDVMLNKIREKLGEFEKLSKSMANENQPKINELKIQLAQNEREIQNLLSKISMANETLMRYINQQIEMLEAERQSINSEILKYTGTVNKDTISAVYAHTENWENLSFEDKQTVVDTLIEVIYVADGQIHIIWRI